MADLYRQKYDIEAEPLLHPYPEPIPKDLEETELKPMLFGAATPMKLIRQPCCGSTML